MNTILIVLTISVATYIISSVIKGTGFLLFITRFISAVLIVMFLAVSLIGRVKTVEVEVPFIAAKTDNYVLFDTPRGKFISEKHQHFVTENKKFYVIEKYNSWNMKLSDFEFELK